MFNLQAKISSLNNYIKNLVSELVTLTGIQTLTNKTLTSPTISGGTISGATISGTTSAKINTASYTAAGAISTTSGSLIAAIAGSAALAMTMAAPSSIDGTIIHIVSTTDYAHTVTFSTLKDGSGTDKTTATFAAHAGACIKVVAYGSYWYLVDYQNVTLS